MAKAKFNPSDDPFTRGIIRRKVKQLIGRAGFTSSDREDIEQELWLKLIKHLPAFDPKKGTRQAFVVTVVERYAANIFRNKRAEKRDHRRACSLNVTIEFTRDGPTELAQTISDRELDARLGRDRRSDEERADLAMDLDNVIATLPEDWQTLLELRKTQTISEVAREMGVPRTTLNGRILRIRQRFEDAGLREYL